MSHVEDAEFAESVPLAFEMGGASSPSEPVGTRPGASSTTTRRGNDIDDPSPKGASWPLGIHAMNGDPFSQRTDSPTVFGARVVG